MSSWETAELLLLLRPANTSQLHIHTYKSLTDMPYTLAVLGCGTMGIAVLSGVLSSSAELHAPVADSHGSNGNANSNGDAKVNGEGSGSLENSQVLSPDLDYLPNAYIATVAREESARKLTKTFRSMQGGQDVKVLAAKNVEAVQQADVVLLWCANAESNLRKDYRGSGVRLLKLLPCSAASPNWLTLSLPKRACKARSRASSSSPSSPAQRSTSSRAGPRLPRASFAQCQTLPARWETASPAP